MSKNFFLILLFISLNSLAYDFDISGFATFGASRTDGKESFYYRNKINNKINFLEDTLVGLNFSTRLTKNISTSIQFLYQKEIDDTEYYPEIEMAFLRFHLYKNLFLKAGKIKLPIWLITDYRNIGFLYPWVIPPEELYESQTPIQEVTGLSISYLIPFQYIKLKVEGLIGEGRVKFFFLKNFHIPTTSLVLDSYLLGVGTVKHINLSMLMTQMTLKLSYTSGKNSGDSRHFAKFFDKQSGGTSTSTIDDEGIHLLYEFYSAGINYYYKNLEVLSEVGHLSYKEDGQKLMSTLTEYITLAYRWKKIRPHFTLLFGENVIKDPAELNSNPALATLVSQIPPNEAKIRSYAWGLNFLLTNNSNLKLQYKQIHLYGSANTSFLYSSSYKDKNPFNLYSISINAIF